MNSLLALGLLSALRLPQIKNSLTVILLSALLISCGGGGSSTEDFTVFGAGGLNGTSGTAGTTTVAVTDPASFRIGIGTGTSFLDGVIGTSPDANLEAGESVTLSVNIVNTLGNAVTDAAVVAFSSNCAASGLASFSETPISTTNGFVTLTYTAIGCNGNDVITATLQENSVTATVTIVIAPSPVLAVQYVSAINTQLSLAGGATTSTELTFKVTGPNLIPIVGETVSFAINSAVGGASILAGRTTGVTDNQGEVKTILESGTVAGNYFIRATHDASGTLGISEDIVISSGVPEASGFSLSVDKRNISQAYRINGIEVTLSIIAEDHFGNPPSDGTSVSFWAPESGQIGSSCVLVNGECSVNWQSNAARPLDGRLEIIAYTAGAEDYTDNNGNFVFDAADTFTTTAGGDDLGEAYTDENEDGIYNSGEFFVDTNSNGMRDSGNGLWDGPCLTAVDASALCAGNSTVTISATNTIIMSTDTPRLFNTGSFGAPGTGITLNDGGPSVSRINLFIADGNTNADVLGGNPMPGGTTIVFSVDGAGVSLVGNGSFTVDTFASSPTGPYSAAVRAPIAMATPFSADLLLTITPPGEAPIQFSWPITVN
ncbi:hypothetical protein JYU22_03050 [Gammaproteobacteria bacterium AH-315-E17]|nr:hypothetical protein [Gammaproteobacteria bacterium AH-315-E17]